MKRIFYFLPSFAVLFGCGNQNITQTNNRPIVLGDSNTIVTEHDPKYLQDFDMNDAPVAPTRMPKAEPAAMSVPKDTVSKTEAPTSVANGKNISFGTVKMVFAGLALNDARKQNAEKDDGLTYTLGSGDLSGSKLNISGAKQVKVRQRYQSRLALKSGLGNVDLRDLGMYTSEWVNVNEKGGNFDLSGLSKVAFSQVNNAKIKNALDRELRKRKTNSKTIQSWMSEIKQVRTANDQPCQVILDNVQWQISGTDAKGQNFHKNIRVEPK